jgi:hypothetical protein
MPQNKKPQVALAKPTKNASRPAVTQVSAERRASHNGAVKQFDLKAAHDAWKERNGIGLDELW